MIKRVVLFLFLFTFAGFLSAFAVSKPSKNVVGKYQVSPLSCNTPFSEYAPFVLGSEIYFVSDRPENIGISYVSNDVSTSNLYVCKLLDSVTCTKPKSLSEINTTYDDGPLMLNLKNDYRVFSASNAKGKLQIYFSVLDNGKWSKPILHPISRPANSYCHPILADGGKTLYFCSDKEGGYGGMDIYYSRFVNLNWSNPVNLGPKVNSAASELFPFLNANKRLFFSSKRPSGYGGLDIYFWDIADSLNSKTKLIDLPINSAADDFGIFSDSTTYKGYFSSNRNTNGDDNLFYFEKTIPDFPRCEPMKKTSCYTFLKESYSLKDETKGNLYEWDFGDGTKARAKAVKHCYSNPGFYTVKLNVIEAATGITVYNELAYTIAVRPQGLFIDVKDTLYINTPLQMDASSSQLDGYTILNYTWVFNDSTFFKGPKTIYQYSKNGIYRVRLGVSAQNNVTKRVSQFCIEKWILVGDKAYIEKNLKHFKYAELMPDAESFYFDPELNDELNAVTKSSVFNYTELSPDAFALTGEENGDVVLSEAERKKRTHKYGLLNSDQNDLSDLTAEEAALLEQMRRQKTHKYNALGADTSKMSGLSEEEALLKAKHRLMRLKNSSLPPIVDTLYFPKETEETIFRVNLGWSDSKVDKSSGVFEGIQKLEEIKEGNRYRYTSGKEKDLTDIVPYYENAKTKGFKNAAVVGFVNDKVGEGQAKNLKAILFDSATVERNAVKVFFKFDVETYDTKYNVQLDSLVKKCLESSKQNVLLITHFDGVGSVEYNMNLNTRRNNIMINYLVKKGIKKSQIKTQFIIHPTEKLEPDLLRRIEVFLMN
jgi:outer membrane protein OmpA-like peptidoglycan-associated protein